MKKSKDSPTTREELRQQAASRRNQLVEKKSPVWSCSFCGTEYVHEKNFMKHKCEVREKLDVLRSGTGQRAYNLYTLWMTKKGRKVPSQNVFLDSHYFNTFINFAAYMKKANVHDVDYYIDVMIERDFDPVMWAKDSQYAYYKAKKLILSLRPN